MGVLRVRPLLPPKDHRCKFKPLKGPIDLTASPLVQRQLLLILFLNASPSAADLPTRTPQPSAHGGERPLRDDTPLLSSEQPVMLEYDYRRLGGGGRLVGVALFNALEVRYVLLQQLVILGLSQAQRSENVRWHA